MSIRVFNADDHPMLRRGISELIQEQADLEWVGSAGQGQEALQKLRTLQPEVAILDIEMPEMDGLTVARTLIQEGSATRFILFTLFKDEDFFHQALEVGVMGYLLKESSEREILDCIHSVHQGRSYINPSLTYYLVKKKQTEDSLLSKLSDQELNILKLIARQKTTAEIADMLFISPKTVGNHRTNISRKLALEGKQNGLLQWAIEHRNLLT